MIYYYFFFKSKTAWKFKEDNTSEETKLTLKTEQHISFLE